MKPFAADMAQDGAGKVPADAGLVYPSDVKAPMYCCRAA
jgi:hypothetical protein